jgi:hypothetical protein
MRLQRYVLVIGFFLAGLLSACAGGSGSSGFDNFPSSENAAIQTALDEQRCVAFHRLSICPADTTTGLPANPTPTPEPSSTPTPSVLIPTPQTTASVTPTRRATAPAAPTATPTPTATLPAPRVDTGINDAAVPCAAVADSDSCVLVLPFAPEGFPAGTIFRVAARTVDPPSAWTIGPDLVPSGAPDSPVFDAPVAINAAADVADSTERVQLAVLAFLAPPKNAPGTVDLLDDSGADYAFVTGELSLQTLRAVP